MSEQEPQGTRGDGREAEKGALYEAAGWLCFGLLNTAFVILSSPAHGLLERGTLHAYDLLYFAFLAALAALARFAWSSFSRVPRVPRLAKLLAATVLLAVLCNFAFAEDLASFLERQSFPSWLPARALFALVAAGTYVGFSLVSEWVGARVTRWLPALLLVLLVTANNLLLPPDYPGTHLLAAACAARLATALLERATPSFRPTRKLSGAVLLGLTLCCALTLTARPSPRIWTHLFAIPGSVAVPYLAPWLGTVPELRNAYVPKEFAAWFQDRSAHPAVAPHRWKQRPQNPLVIFLTIDALRADVVSSGEHDAQLPELAKLRDSSLYFTVARSPTPSTLTTVTSMMTGKYYSQTYWSPVGNGVLPHADTSPRLAGLLSERGVRTSHVMALHGLGSGGGVGAGFQHERRTKKNYGRAENLMDLLLEEVQAAGNSPAFFYGHFVDPHQPYNLGGGGGSAYERYLREVALVDRELGRLREFLHANRLQKRVILIVSADHGEAFGEHGMNYHARSVYEELLRIPLAIQLPAGVPRKISVPVTLMDIAPTVLDIFEIATPGHMMGESLLPVFDNGTLAPTRPIVADAGRRIQALLYPDGVKVIRDLKRKTVEVYDLSADPGEERNRVDATGFDGERYVAGLEAFFRIHTLRRPGWEPPWRKF